MPFMRTGESARDGDAWTEPPNNLMAAGTVTLGALVVLLLGARLMSVTTLLLPFTTANFIYIATASLMPELQQERGLRQSLTQTALFLTGSFLMFSSGGSEPR